MRTMLRFFTHILWMLAFVDALSVTNPGWQSIELHFGNEDMNALTNQEPKITDILTRITKISKFETYQRQKKPEMDHTSESQPFMVRVEIETNNDTIPKIASWTKLLEYDNTLTFKALFNELMAEYDEPNAYLIRVGNDYFTDMPLWSGYLTQETIFDEESSIGAVGGGVLYTMEAGVPQTFCNDSWGWEETQVACRTMGYDFGVPLPGGFHGLQNPDFTPSMLYNADCDGSEGSIWDCSMNTNNGTNTECCSDCYDKSVAVYCSRFFPTTTAPIRVFETYNSYQQFLPLIYGPYSDGENSMFSTFCYDQIINSWTELNIGNVICNKFGFVEGNTIKASGLDHHIGEAVQSVDLTYFDESTAEWDFSPSCNEHCNNHTSDIAVECMVTEDGLDGTYCHQNGMQCATDLDCCDQMFCSPVKGKCVDPSMLLERGMEVGCTTNNECESGYCGPSSPSTDSMPELSSSERDLTSLEQPTSNPASTQRRRLVATPGAAMPTVVGSDQFLYLIFGPRAPIDFILEWKHSIFEALVIITKIEQDNWHYWGEVDQTDIMSSMGESFVKIKWKIDNIDLTRAKILTLKKLLEYDQGEQFKTLFNSYTMEQNPDLYIISVHEASLNGIQSESGVLGQHSWLAAADEVLGHGALYTKTDTTEVRLFCDNTWGWTETQVACRTMGFEFGIFLPGAGAAYDSADAIMMMAMLSPYYGNVDCFGDENSIWECAMDTDVSTVTGCTSVHETVSLYCVRFSLDYIQNARKNFEKQKLKEPGAERLPIRMLKSYNSYNEFVPILYPPYDPATPSTICWDSFESEQNARELDIATYLCSKYGVGPGFVGTAHDWSQTVDAWVDRDADYFLAEVGADIGSADLINIVADTEGKLNFEWDPTEYDGCSDQINVLAIECANTVPAFCVGSQNACAMDLDCCQDDNKHFFCDPLLGYCVDIQQDIKKPDGYIPCWSNTECESGNCLTPGVAGMCSATGSSSHATCFDIHQRCFKDEQCCEGYTCDQGSCQVDPFNGQEPQFTSLTPDQMNSPQQHFQIIGQNLRPSMLFKLSTTGTCQNDRSPVLDAPNGHYAARADGWDGQSLSFTLRVYNTAAYGAKLLLCYAVNDYANFKSTGLFVRVPQLVDDRHVDKLITGEVEWEHGSTNILEEGASSKYTEYSIKLSRCLKDDEWIEMDTFEHEFDNLMYPQTSWFYHQEKYISESIKIEYDVGVDGVTPGRRVDDCLPIKVRLNWVNDGFPEIMDREFHLIHTISGQTDYGYIEKFFLAHIQFILKDDDPQIEANSLRFQGDSGPGTDHLQGTLGGDEGLQFTCKGCGTDEFSHLVQIYYGPDTDSVTDRRYYSGTNPWISAIFDDSTYELTASYVQFTTSYMTGLAEAEISNLYFEIEVGSRFDASVTKTLRPDFRFDYPADIDEDSPIIERVEGDGCDNIGTRALNCPTDGQYQGNPARITLHGRRFPDSSDSIQITIDGTQCNNPGEPSDEAAGGFRSVSCEFGRGVSPYGVDGYSYVQLSYFDGIAAKTLSSAPVRYFSYSPPEITGVTGCEPGDSPLHTTNCIRTGGGNIKLIITGKNFGFRGARVLIGGTEALETLHDGSNPHGKLLVKYGPGTRLNERVVLLNSKGGSTTQDAFISYTQCPEGMRQKNQIEHSNSRDNEGFLCVDCEAGEYSNTLNSQECFKCDPGEHQPAKKQTSCSKCPAGTVADGSGNAQCTPCGPGGYSPSDGGTECTPCADLQFNMLSQQATCHRCGANSFSEEHARNQCLCEEGYYKYGVEEVEGAKDPDGNPVVQTRVLCKQCSEGMLCHQPGLDHTEIVPLEGYYPMLNTEPETLAMIKCINAACIGGDQLCKEGFTGTLCTSCDEGLGKTSGHGCETCLSPVTNAIRLLGVLGIVSFIIIFFIHRTTKSALQQKSDLSAIGKIGFSFLQFNSMALQFDYEFPPMLEGFLKIQEQPATVANGVLSIDCFVKDSPASVSSLYVKSIIYLVAPIMVAVLCSVVCCKYKCMKRTKHDVDRSRLAARKMTNLARLSRMELPEDSKAKAYVNAWNSYITAFIITIFMIHPSIVQMTFALFNCMELGANEDDWYLVEDMSVSCRTSTHTYFQMFVGGPMMLFYVIGMPLFVLWRLWRNRDELRKPFSKIKPDIINRYHFLIKGYQPKTYYWEIIIMARKILMAVVAVFASYDIQVQTLLATLLVVVVLSIHAYSLPYTSDSLNGLELLSLFGSFCTYFFGQFLFAEAVGQTGKTIVSVVVVAVNFSVLLAIGLMIMGKGAAMVAAIGKKLAEFNTGKKKLKKVKTPRQPGQDGIEMKEMERKSRGKVAKRASRPPPVQLYPHHQGQHLVPSSPVPSVSPGSESPINPEMFTYGVGHSPVHQQRNIRESREALVGQQPAAVSRPSLLSSPVAQQNYVAPMGAQQQFQPLPVSSPSGVSGRDDSNALDRGISAEEAYAIDDSGSLDDSSTPSIRIQDGDGVEIGQMFIADK